MTHRPLLPFVNSRLARTLLLCGLMVLCLPGQTQGELRTAGERVDHETVQQLMRQARYAEALAESEQYLREHPRDPQMLFMRARLLADLNRTDESLDQLNTLIQQYPELSEPYNNLGVIQAARGHLDQARESFEMALRNNPNHAIALENLGDVLLRQARLAYEKSLKINPGSPSLPRKLQALTTP